MAVLSNTVFGGILWGAVVAVAIVFFYEVYAVSLEFGWLTRK